MIGFLLASGRTLTQACQYVGYVNHEICESLRKIHSIYGRKGASFVPQGQ